MKQLGLPLGPAHTSKRKSAGVVKNAIPVAQSTFKGGQVARVHRWFRLTPSFGPELVDGMLTRMGAELGAHVHDPFAGASTTLIQCKLRGYETSGVEINPLLHFVGTTCLEWDLNPSKLTGLRRELTARFLDAQNTHANKSIDELEMDIPPIHNVYRWWRADVLKDLLILRHCIDSLMGSTKEKNFFHLCLLGILVPDLTNVTLGRLQLHFIDRTHDLIDVWDAFSRHLERMLEDVNYLHSLAELPQTKSNLWNADSTLLRGVSFDRPIEYVVTSPPYPNRYSYVWNTRPHLYFGRFFTEKHEAGTLDMATIGGTWGTATSCLAKDIIQPTCSAVDKHISPIVAQIRTEDPLMANYLMKYFNLLTTQIRVLLHHATPELRVAYVVGCSWLKGVYVETDVLLAHIFEELGFSLDGIERFRQRHSGKDLHESIVYAKRQLA